MSALQEVGFWAVGIFAAGLIIGAVAAVKILNAGLESGARLARVGRASPGHVAPVVPGVEGSRGPAPGASVEYIAAEKAMERVLDRGEAAIMEIEPHLTPAQARAKARKALEEAGAFNLSGGIASP